MDGPDRRESARTPVLINSERPHRSKQNSRARFVEDVVDGTRIIDSEDSPYRQREKSSGSRRGTSSHSRYHHRSHDHDDDDDAHSPTHRWRRTSNRHDYHYDNYSDDSKLAHRSRRRNSLSEDTDFDPELDPLAPDHRHVLPSLTFHFKLGKVATEEEYQTSTAPRSVKQSARPDAKEYRYKLYHENIFNVVRSRYTDGIHGRHNSTVELVTDSAHEALGRRRPELVKWMYALPIQDTSLAKSIETAKLRDSIRILICSS